MLKKIWQNLEWILLTIGFVVCITANVLYELDIVSLDMVSKILFSGVLIMAMGIPIIAMGIPISLNAGR